jgi:ABC-type transport system involved in multi-copper enzyme maturation permease subunit
MTAPAWPDRDVSLRPVPWRRMAWVTWRQHRLAFAGVAAMFGVAAIYVLTTGLQMHYAYSAVTACRPTGSSICQQLADNFQNTYAPRVAATVIVFQVLPALVGAFIGAPLLARELETGTFRYAWTQGFGRTRWTVAKLGVLAVAVMLVAGAFSALLSWYSQPITGAVHHPIHSNPLDLIDPTIFDLLGVALAAWVLAAFAIGALAGVLIRRVVPAMFATLAAWTGLAYGTGSFLRQHYAEPMTTAGSPTKLEGIHGWVLGWEWARGGKPASLSLINQTLHAIHIQADGPLSFQPDGPANPSVPIDPVNYLMQHGYALLIINQPDSRFWTFQWIEGGWLLALSLLLLAGTVWLVRHRAA